MRACVSKARMPAASEFVVLAVGDEFSISEGVVKSAVIQVKMRTDQRIDIGRAKLEFGEMFEDVFFVLRGRRTGRESVGGHAGIDQNALVGGG